MEVGVLCGASHSIMSHSLSNYEAKHFLRDGGTFNGKNEGTTIASYDDLEQIHVAPYLACISRGVCTVMISYSSCNGKPLHSSRFLLTEILKEKLGFKVVWFTTHI